MVDKDLLEILACPKCKGRVEYNEKDKSLFCPACRLLYEIRNDIPIMLVDAAQKVD
ncbi:MAG: Trm112 family protein [Pseudomonadota bacterium]